MKMVNLMTATEVGEMLRLKPETVKRLARVGQIPAIRVNNKVLRFDPQAVLGAIREQHSESGGQNA